MHATIHHEVHGPVQHGGWQLCFQWCTYNYDDGTTQDGYRFIWRRPNGNLQAGRAQARIPDAEQLFDLLRKAKAAGWFPEFDPVSLTTGVTR